VTLDRLPIEFIGSFPDPLYPLDPRLPEIAFVGRSNVGKSSLFNALLESERSLVHDEPVRPPGARAHRDEGRQELREEGRPLLDAQRTRLAVQIGANDSSTQLLLDSVQLYKALGGGWQVFEPVQKEPS